MTQPGYVDRAIAEQAVAVGPISPLHCTIPGCWWTAYGIPDRYADSRANHLQQHMDEEHMPVNTEPADSQPLDLDTIQALHEAATEGTWWCDGPEIYAGQPDIPAASTNIGETLQFDLPDHGDANAAAIVAAHNALPALIARVQELEQQLADAQASQLADWAAELTTDALEPYDGTITLNGDDEPFARIHLAFHSDMDDADRNEFIATLGRVMLRAL